MLLARDGYPSLPGKWVIGVGFASGWFPADISAIEHGSVRNEYRNRRGRRRNAARLGLRFEWIGGLERISTICAEGGELCLARANRHKAAIVVRE